MSMAELQVNDGAGERPDPTGPRVPPLAASSRPVDDRRAGDGGGAARARLSLVPLERAERRGGVDARCRRHRRADRWSLAGDRRDRTDGGRPRQAAPDQRPATAPPRSAKSSGSIPISPAWCAAASTSIIRAIRSAMRSRPSAGRRAGDFARFIVVTSNYHMPRALAEIAHQMPGVELVPFPVVTDKQRAEPWWRTVAAARLMISEYVKYVYRQAPHEPSSRCAAGRTGRAGRSPARQVGIVVAWQSVAPSSAMRRCRKPDCHARSGPVPVILRSICLQRPVLSESLRADHRGAADAGHAALGASSRSRGSGRAAISGCCGLSAARGSSFAAWRKFRRGRCWSPPSISRCGRRSR